MTAPVNERSASSADDNADFDAIMDRAEALPSTSPLRAALEALAFALDDRRVMGDRSGYTDADIEELRADARAWEARP